MEKSCLWWRNFRWSESFWNPLKPCAFLRSACCYILFDTCWVLLFDLKWRWRSNQKSKEYHCQYASRNPYTPRSIYLLAGLSYFIIIHYENDITLFPLTSSFYFPDRNLKCSKYYRSYYNWPEFYQRLWFKFMYRTIMIFCSTKCYGLNNKILHIPCRFMSCIVYCRELSPLLNGWNQWWIKISGQRENYENTHRSCYTYALVSDTQCRSSLDIPIISIKKIWDTSDFFYRSYFFWSSSSDTLYTTGLPCGQVAL